MRRALLALALLIVVGTDARALTDAVWNQKQHAANFPLDQLPAPSAAASPSTAPVRPIDLNPAGAPCILSAPGANGLPVCATPLTSLSVTDPISSTGGASPTLGLKFTNVDLILTVPGALEVAAFTGAITKAAGATSTIFGSAGPHTVLANLTGGSAVPTFTGPATGGQFLGDSGWASVPTTSITGLAAIATSGSATDLIAGTVPAARVPAFVGAITTAGGTLTTAFGTQTGNSFFGVAGGSTAVPAAISCATPGTFAGNVAGTLGCTSTIPATSAPLATTAIGFGDSGGLLTGNASVLSWDGTNVKIVGGLKVSTLTGSVVPLSGSIVVSPSGSTPLITSAGLNVTLNSTLSHLSFGSGIGPAESYLDVIATNLGHIRTTMLDTGIFSAFELQSTGYAYSGAFPANTDIVLVNGGAYTRFNPGAQQVKDFQIGFVYSGPYSGYDPQMKIAAMSYDMYLGWQSTPATTDTGAYLWLRSVAGVPTGVPANPITSFTPQVIDTTDNRWYVYNSGWKPYGQYTGNTAGFLKNNSGGLWTVDTTTYVPTTRTLTTTAPMTCNGSSSCDLSANDTLAVPVFAGSAAGLVPSSAGGTTNFLRADGAYAVPPGSAGITAGTGPVTFSGTGSVATAINFGGGSLSGLLPLVNLTPGTNGQILTTTGGVATWSSASAPGITQLTGDGTAGPGSGSQVFTLVNIGNDVTAAGDIKFTAIAAPATPGAGTGRGYEDSTSLNWAFKNASGVINHGIQTNSGVSHEWISAIAADGSVTLSRPDYTDLTGTPTIYNQTIQANGTPQTQEPVFNFDANFSLSVGGGKNTISLGAPLSPSNTFGSAGQFIQAFTTDASGRVSGATPTNFPAATELLIAASGAAPVGDATLTFNTSTHVLAAGTGVAINGVSVPTNAYLVGGHSTNADQDRVQFFVGAGTLGPTGTGDGSFVDIIPTSTPIRGGVTAGIYSTERIEQAAYTGTGQTITEATSLYIDEAPSLTTVSGQHYALHVAAGPTSLDGSLTLPAIAGGTLVTDGAGHVSASGGALMYSKDYYFDIPGALISGTPNWIATSSPTVFSSSAIEYAVPYAVSGVHMFISGRITNNPIVGGIAPGISIRITKNGTAMVGVLQTFGIGVTGNFNGIFVSTTSFAAGDMLGAQIITNATLAGTNFTGTVSFGWDQEQ